MKKYGFAKKIERMKNRAETKIAHSKRIKIRNLMVIKNVI